MTSIRSIFGECRGKVRSTPTPNELLRTVNVSRAPAPWRLITIPSKTWTRRRCPSITWKWTRTVPPALNSGISSRSWRCSMRSIGLAMERRALWAAENLAEADPLRRPVDCENLADDVLARNRAPDPTVARLAAIVAHHEVLTVRDGAPREGVVVPLSLVEVRLLERLPVDHDDAVAKRDLLSGHPDEALDERAAGPAA